MGTDILTYEGNKKHVPLVEVKILFILFYFFNRDYNCLMVIMICSGNFFSHCHEWCY